MNDETEKLADFDLLIAVLDFKVHRTIDFPLLLLTKNTIWHHITIAASFAKR